jgi:large subunit ribosomal protein L4
VVLAPEQTVAQKSFRNLERVSVLPVEAAGVADIVGAAQLVLTQEALDALTARASAAVRAKGAAA